MSFRVVSRTGRVQNRKAPALCRGFRYEGGDDLLSHNSYAVSSALRGLTSLFGMGRGGPPRYSHHMFLLCPDIVRKKTPATDSKRLALASRAASNVCQYPAADKAFGLLVLLGSTHHCDYTCSLSTS